MNYRKFTGITSVIFHIFGIIFIGFVMTDYFAQSDSSTKDIFANSTWAIIIVALFTFLWVGRISQLESSVSYTQKKCDDIRSELQKELKDLSETEAEKWKKEGESLAKRVDRILENHPWLDEITKRDFVVESTNCRSVYHSIIHLYESKKLSHLSEYIDYLLHPPKNSLLKERGGLDGSLSDFQRISNFCYFYLDDEYLSHQFLIRMVDKIGRNNISCATTTLFSSIRSGDLRLAGSLHRSLRARLTYPWWKFWHRLALSKLDQGKAEAASALYLVTVGKRRKARRLLVKSQKNLNDIDEECARLFKDEYNTLDSPESIQCDSEDEQIFIGPEMARAKIAILKNLNKGIEAKKFQNKVKSLLDPVTCAPRILNEVEMAVERNIVTNGSATKSNNMPSKEAHQPTEENDRTHHAKKQVDREI